MLYFSCLLRNVELQEKLGETKIMAAKYKEMFETLKKLANDRATKPVSPSCLPDSIKPPSSVVATQQKLWYASKEHCILQLMILIAYLYHLQF